MFKLNANILFKNLNFLFSLYKFTKNNSLKVKKGICKINNLEKN
jgi:hypothetical protein